jgi:hypothetical protein
MLSMHWTMKLSSEPVLFDAPVAKALLDELQGRNINNSSEPLLERTKELFGMLAVNEQKQFLMWAKESEAAKQHGEAVVPGPRGEKAMTEKRKEQMPSANQRSREKRRAAQKLKIPSWKPDSAS